MTSLVAPGGKFGAEHDAPNSLRQVDFTLLEMGALLHELVGVDRLYYLVEDCVYAVD